MEYLLGIDVGTTGTKSILIKPDGKVVCEAGGDYPLSTPRPLWSEQNPDHWAQGAAKSIHAVIEKSNIAPEQIKGVGLTGQMHGLVLLDENLNVLRPAILWNDQRTGYQCDTITHRIGFERIIALTGNRVLPGFTAPKILWVRENEPEVFSRIAHFLLPKDYIRVRLTGEIATDVSDASGTSLFDVVNRRWSAQMLAALEIPENWAPPCSESHEISGTVSKKGALLFGLAPGTPVVAGAGDQAAGAIGMGLTNQGTVSATLGTSGVVFAPTSHPLIEPSGLLHAFCHGAPGMWHVMGVMLSAAGSLRWFRDALCKQETNRAHSMGADPYDLILESAAQIPPGSEGLLFLPYLTGERTPYSDPNAKGAFIGLTLRHTKAHMTRAVMEGITFGMRDCLDLIRAQGISTGRIRTSGGGAKSSLWLQMMADVFNAEVVTPATTSGAAFGAALLGAVGAAHYTNIHEACEKCVRVNTSIQPDPVNVEIYQRIFEIYQMGYKGCKPMFHALAGLDS